MSDRDRRFPVACGLALCATVAAGLAASPAQAQLTPKPDPSPLAPGDLKRPIFDTQTPVYATTGQQAASANRVVAEVDGRPVTLGDVADVIAQLPETTRNQPFTDLFPQVLTQLVHEQALVIRAQQQALDDNPVVRRKLKAAADQVMANALLEQEAARSITEAALLQRYDKDIAGKPGPDEVRVGVIMLSTEPEATSIIAQLRGGADFAALAKRSSQDPTARNGGDAGFVTFEGLTPEIGAVVFSLQPGQFTQFPVQSAPGWFVLQVAERRPGSAPTFSAARASLRQAMLREHAADVAAAAVAAVTIREYDIAGKETNASPADRTRPAQ